MGLVNTVIRKSQVFARVVCTISATNRVEANRYTTTPNSDTLNPVKGKHIFSTNTETLMRGREVKKTQLRNATSLVAKTLEVLNLGVAGINALCDDISPIDQATGDVILELLEFQELGIMALSAHLEELRLKSVLDLEGVSIPRDCPECEAELIQLKNKDLFCLVCNETYPMEDYDETDQ